MGCPERASPASDQSLADEDELQGVGGACEP